MNREYEGKLVQAVRKNRAAQMEIRANHRREVTSLLEKQGLEVSCLDE